VARVVKRLAVIIDLDMVESILIAGDWVRRVEKYSM